jgi:hypothetical protein
LDTLLRIYRLSTGHDSCVSMDAAGTCFPN